MEKFNQLKGMLLSFEFDAVEHNNQRYLVMRNLIEDFNYTIDKIDLLNDSIFELLEVDNVGAIKKLSYLESLMNELAKFQKDGPIQSFFNLVTICNNRSILIIVPIHDIDWVITDNLIDDISDDIAARMTIVKEIKTALIRVIEGIEPPMASHDLTMSDRERRALDNNYKVDELPVRVWDEIKERAQLVTVADSNKPADPPTAHTLLNYIVNNDTVFYNKVVNHYRNVKAPKSIHGMLTALDQVQYLNTKISEMSYTDWTAIINRSLNTNFSRQSLFNVNRKNNTANKELVVIKGFM